MSLEKELVKTAILGTAKYSTNTKGSVLTAEMDQIKTLQKDSEDALLKASFLALNYYEAGAQTLEIDHDHDHAPDERRNYAPRSFQHALASALNNGKVQLMDYALQQLEQHSLLVAPHLIPQMLDFAAKHQSLAKPAFLHSLGIRANWLSQFNKTWQKLYEQNIETNDWELMDFEARKHYLAHLRKTDPAEVVKWLAEVFQQENAQKRLGFLEILEENAGPYDEAFLLNLLQDRSTKVQDKAKEFLSKIPGSTVNQAFVEHFFNVVHIKEERRMLINKKRVLEVKNKRPDDILFEFGLVEISSTKGFADHMFWMAQCVRYVNPEDIAEKYFLPKEEIFKLFINHQDYHLLHEYLAEWAINQKDAVLAHLLLEKSGISPEFMPLMEDLLEVLPKQQRTIVLLNNLPKNVGGQAEPAASQAIDYIVNKNEPLAMEMATAILQVLKSKPLIVNTERYKALAYLLPTGCVKPIQEIIRQTGDGIFEGNFLKNQLREMSLILEEKTRLTL